MEDMHIMNYNYNEFIIMNLHALALPFVSLGNVELATLFHSEGKLRYEDYSCIVYNPFHIDSKFTNNRHPDDFIDPKIKFEVMKCPYYSTDDYSELLAGQNVKDFTNMHPKILGGYE